MSTAPVFLDTGRALYVSPADRRVLRDVAIDDSHWTPRQIARAGRTYTLRAVRVDREAPSLARHDGPGGTHHTAASR